MPSPSTSIRRAGTWRSSSRAPAPAGRVVSPIRPIRVNGLFEAVRHTVAGASRGCAQLFGAEEDVTACGITLLTDNQVPGTPGVAGLRSLIEDGRRVVVF